MPALRVLFGILIYLIAQPSLAAEVKDPAQCAATMLEYVERLELYAAGVQEVIPLLADAQRKGDEALATHLARLLESNRVDGVGDMLRRIEEEYVACGKGLFDAELIARVDAARPWAAATDAPLDVEAPPILEIADITSTFVPYETTDGGSCTGPYIDLAIKMTNRGGTFPRQVDLDVRRRTWPTSDTWGYLLIVLQFAYDNGEEGQEQVSVFPGDLPHGVIAAGGTVTVPMRIQIFNNRKHVTITGWFEGGSLAVAENDGMRGPPFSFEADIPIWDAYTQSVQVVSGPSREDKRILTGAIKASIVNLGQSPFPGPITGNFDVRQPQDGPRLLVTSGRSLGSSSEILAGNEVRALIKGKTFVELSISLLCPNGSYGSLADGNIENNNRVLQGNGG